MDRKFRKGDMVWAKVRGFPWWPGVIKNIFLKPSKDSANVEKEPHAKVYFVGDSTYIQVPFDKLFRFDSKLPEFSRTKNKRLLKSIAITKKIINGEISFENHLTHYEDTHSDSDEEECEANITTDSVKQASVPTAVTSNDKEKLLGLKRLRKLKGNININININLNNNSNNTVEIIKDKSIEDEDEEFSSESEDERCDPSPSDEIKKAIDKLLRYKIEMPLSTSNKFIVRSLDEIEKILKSNKKLPSHILTKDLLPVLLSFLGDRNQNLFIKSSEVLTMVKESVIADLFEFDEGEFECLIERSSNPGNPVILTRINDEDSLTYDLKAKIGGCDMFKGETSRKRSTRKISEENRTFQTGGVKENSMRLENKGSTSGNQNQIIFQNVLKEENQSKGRRFRLKPRGASNELNSPFILPRPRLFPRHNNIRKIIVNRKEQDDNNNDNDVNKPTSRKSEVKKPRTVPKKNFNKIPRTCFKALNSKEAEFIFKGFISDEDNSEIVDIKEKINMGKYHTPFYENIYTKYNGLDERLAFKRKNVCLKLLSILKIILPEINLDELKKTIIFLEYKIRIKDPSLGEIYKENWEKFYERIKGVLALTVSTLKNL